MEMRRKYSYKHINHGISNNLMNTLPKLNQSSTAWSMHYRAFFLTKAITTNVGLDVVKMGELF